MIKTSIQAILALSLTLNLCLADVYDPVLKSPTAFFREIAKVILETPVSWDEPVSSPNQLNENIAKFLKVQNAINKQQGLNNRFGIEVQKIIAENSVLNGHELHLLTKILGATHSLSARALEYSSLYHIGNQMNDEKIVIQENSELTKRNLIWLSTHVNLFGVYRDGYLHFYRKGNIRRIVKNILKADSKKNHKLRELGQMIEHTTSKKNRSKLRDYLIDYRKNKSELQRLSKTDEKIRSLMQTIDENKITNELLSDASLRLKKHSFIDGFVSFLDKSMNIISAFFGNTVGAVRWRKGYLHEDKQVISNLKSVLRPLDMIFEKTPFALTDTFIPGNFGHAAMYIGTEEQLKEIGMWNHPSVIPHHKNLKKGHVIVEALRPGVRTASIREWMNIDEILILRHPSVLKDDKDEVFQMYSRIMNQIGKKYDFNFDVTTTDKVVCSELVYHAFGKINWPTKYIMGRATISPDDVAQVVLYKDSPIDFHSYLFSKKRGKVERLNMDDLAKRLGFIKNIERSTNELASYDRSVRKCRTVRRTNLRQGSHRYKHRLITVCKTEYKELDYKNLQRSYSIDKRHAEDGNH